MGRSLAARALEPLTLRRAAALSASYPEERRDRIRELGSASARRALAARAMRQDENDIAALALEREAAALAISAWLVARGEHDGRPLPPDEAWARLGPVPDAPAALETARVWLASKEDLALDRLRPREARRLRASTARALGWLLDQIEVRTPREVKWARVRRIVGTLVTTVSGVLLFLWLFVFPWNVAAHKPVQVSSQRSGVGKSAVLTDGETGRVLFGTTHQEQPWVRIDLLDPFVISKVVIYSANGSAVPLVVELSDDDRHWTEVARGGSDRVPRWQLGFAKRRARYVRLRHPDTGMLSLSEVEVLGRRP